jgi:predicted Zn-dependent protease
MRMAAALVLGLSLLTHAQDTFDDLARRAEAVLDRQPGEAAGLYRRALALRPDWAEGWLYLGAALYQLDRYAEATEAFRKGTALAPQQGTGWAFLGLSGAALGNSIQALADIRKGEQLGLTGDPQFELAVRVKAAQLLITTSAFNEALEQLQPLSARDQNSRVLEETMGLATLAIPRSLSELSPSQRAVVALAGKAAWALGSQRPADASAGYKQLLAQYPNEAGVHYAYGLYLMETDLAAALAEFRRETQNNPGHWPALVALGSLETRSGNPQAAIPALRNALKMAPAGQRWACHAELGRAILASEKSEGAIAELETAVRLKPDSPQVHSYLSQAYRRAGRTADAQREAAEFQKYKSQQDPLGVGAFRSLLK